MNKHTLMAAVLCAPIFAMAASLDQGLMCNMSAVEFFRPLVQHQIIPAKPYAITGAISHFRPAKHLFSKKGGGLTAFGMPVESVFGYAAGQVMFSTEDPRISSPDLYGAVVREEIANVQAQLSSLNVTKARTRRLTHDTTEISCIGV